MSSLIKNKFKILVITASLAILAFPSKLSASSTLLNENFNDGNVMDGNPTIWTQTENWTIDNGKYIGITSNPNGTGQLSYTGSNSWTDYSLDADITGLQGPDRHILFRFDNSRSPSGYAIKYRETNYGFIGIELQKIGVAVLATNSTITSSLYQTHHVRIEGNTNNIKVYFDSVEVINYIDTDNPILNGGIGLFIEVSGLNNVTNQTSYDNIIVNTIDSSTPTSNPTVSPTPLASPFPTQFPSPNPTNVALSVPDIKQYSSPWENKIYNNYSELSTNETIKKWGCALTSAAMILNYYNHQISVDQLNIWLKQNGGYDSSHGVKFPFVAAYATANENANQNKPGLEFTRENYSVQKLQDEIAYSKPAILEVPNPLSPSGSHFLVAKGTFSNDFLINDPGSNKTLLSQHAFPRSLRLFQPAYTDASYILLYTSSNFIMKAFDPNGIEVSNVYNTEYPLGDNNEGSLAGKPIGILSIPKPSQGEYKIQIGGNTGMYTVESDLINSSGKIQIKSLKGILKAPIFDEIKIIMGKDSQATLIVNIESTINDLDAIYSQNLIKNKNIYILLRSELVSAQNWQLKNKITLYKATLKLVRSEIKKISQKTINYEAKEILLEDINTLLSK